MSLNDAVHLFEMLAPGKLPRVEQLDHQSSLRINAGEVGPLVQVALMTGEGQIAFVIVAPVLASSNVLNMKRQNEIVVFRNAAVFAALARAISH